MAFIDYLTAEGERLLAKSISDSVPVTFTKLVIGSGYLAQGTSEKNVSEIISPVKTVDIKSVTLNNSESAIISAYFNNEGLESGFYFREKGIYMQAGDEEVLGIYGNAGSTAEYIDTTSALVIEKMIRTVLQLSSDEAANISLTEGACAPPPMIVDGMDIEEFINSDLSSTVIEGQVVIINKGVYYFTGGDQHDRSNYDYATGVQMSDVYNAEIPGANASGGIAASQNSLYFAYKELNDCISKTDSKLEEFTESVSNRTASELTYTDTYGVGADTTQAAIDYAITHTQNTENPHEVTASQIGALPLSGGTLIGATYASNNTNYTTSQIRNIKASTTDLTAGTSTLTSGSIYLVYE